MNRYLELRSECGRGWRLSCSQRCSFINILGIISADTLSANSLVLTTPSASPRSYPGVSPLVFHPLTKKQQRNTGERDATGESACAALSARLFRTGAPDILETPRRP